jgi:hypothetical protein
MEVVAQCTRSGGGIEESPVGHEVERASAMVRSLCELEKEKGGDEVRSMRMRVSNVPTRKRKERGGGSVRGRGRKSRADKGARKKRGVLCKRMRRGRHHVVAT